MSKIFVKSSSGIMGGSNTRIYNPRSESSHMYRNNHEEEDKYGAESSEARDDKYDKKLRVKEKKDKEKNKIKHFKMTAKDLVGLEDEKEEAEEGDKFDTDRELSAQTGPAGNMGFLTSLAAQAKGPGAAGGNAFAMGEPMEIAYQLLKSKELSEKTKKKKRERRKTKEKRKQWRPST